MVQIQVVEDSLAYSGSLVTGVVYFDFGEFQFPESGWNDFVVVVLGWWLSHLIDLVKGITPAIELRFMDGPLWIVVQQRAADRCAMQCIEGPDQVEYEHEGSAMGLLRSTLSTAVIILKICEQRGWRTADLEKLENYIEEAKALTEP